MPLLHLRLRLFSWEIRIPDAKPATMLTTAPDHPLPASGVLQLVGQRRQTAARSWLGRRFAEIRVETRLTTSATRHTITKTGAILMRYQNMPHDARRIKRAASSNRQRSASPLTSLCSDKTLNHSIMQRLKRRGHDCRGLWSSD